MASIEPSEVLEDASSFPPDIFSPPTNHAEWRLALVDVKWLCLNQQYKQCYSRCQQLIDTVSEPLHPIRATYLHYYAATSYEFLGRAAHISSNAKVPLLTSALDSFEAALAAMPAALPVALPQPIVNPLQSYSPLSTTPYSRSISPQFDLSPLSPSGHIWSPTQSPGPTPQDNSVPDVEVSTPSDGIWTPPAPASVPDASSAHDQKDPSYQDVGPFQTPPPLAALNASLSPRSTSSLTTMFCVTPPLAAGKVSRPVYDARTPTFNTTTPPRPPPSIPHGFLSNPSVGERLAGFGTDDSGLQKGKNVVKKMARMIDGSLLDQSDDPFVSRERTAPRPATRPLVHLSPIKFPAELKDPAKQIELLPSPLQIRKVSGETIICDGPGVVIRNTSQEQVDEIVRKRNDRVRPPRLPLKIIPWNNEIANTMIIKSPVPAPGSMRFGPILPMAIPKPIVSPSSMPMPPATPSPLVQNNTPALGSPFSTPPHSPGPESMSPYSPPRSPVDTVYPVGAAEAIEFNKSIRWLRDHIPQDVSNLRKQIQHVERFQEARRDRTKMSHSSSFWTFTPVKKQAGAETDDADLWDGPNIDEYGNQLRIETREQRIKRLRKEGWKTGIRSKHSLFKGTEYYDKLCETALAELGDRPGLTVEGHAYLRKW